MQKKLFLAVILFFAGVTCRAQSGPPADAIIRNAARTAASGNKKILVIFHASWCGWCAKMEASIKDPRCEKLFGNHYVVVYLDVLERLEKKGLETPGSLDLLKQYKAEKDGLPFWVIQDTKGNRLADSRMPSVTTGQGAPGQNIGCPAEPAEVTYFTQVLKATSSLTDAELEVIEKRLLENKGS
jgi:thioredoxin-related protein